MNDMNTFTRHILVIGTALCAGAPACMQESDVVRWEPVDAPEIRSQLAFPTANVDASTIEEVQAQVLEDRLPLAQTLDLLDFGFDRAHQNAMSDGEDPLEDAPELGSVQLFALVACPGMEVGPDPEFVHGTVRIETPSVSDVDLDEWSVEGDALAIFEECGVDGTLMTGIAPLYREGDHAVVALPSLSVTPPNGRKSFEFDTPFIGDATRAEALYELADGSTLAVTVPRQADALVLRGRNGSFSCLQVAPGLLRCDASD